MILAGQRRVLRQEPRLCDRGSSFRSPAVINVRYRTDCDGRRDQTAIEVSTRLAAVYVRSDRAKANGRPEWGEVLTFALCD
jgi:hypothetical protein